MDDDDLKKFKNFMLYKIPLTDREMEEASPAFCWILVAIIIFVADIVLVLSL